MEETTTVAPTDGGAGAPAEPAKVEQQPAEAPQEPESQTAQVDETAEWLQSKGVDPTDPEALTKLAKMAFNQEKLMTKATQRASELEKSMNQPQQQAGEDETGMDRINAYIARQERKEQLDTFKQSHPDWQKYDESMGSLLEQPLETVYGTVTRRDLIDSGLLTLDDVYAMAKGQTPVDTSQIQAQTRTEVLQTLANTQRAGGGNAHASETNPQAPKVDPVIEAIRRSRGE